MNIKCPHCGTEYEVEQKYMYRYTKCEVCRKGFVIGASKSLQEDGARGSTAESVDAKSENSVVQTEERKKPHLGIRRPSIQIPQSSVVMEDKLRAAINVQPIKEPSFTPNGVVTAAEERVKLFEDMRRKERRQKMLRDFFDTTLLLGTLVVMVGLCLWWMWHKNKVAEDEIRFANEAEAERIRLSEERDRVERERREKDRLEKEAALRKKRAEEQRLQMEAEQKALMEKAERDRIERERREGQENYQIRLTMLRESKFMLWGPSVTNGMEKTGGELCYLLPSLESQPLIVYQILWGTNGEQRVFRLYEDGKLDESDAAAFANRIKDVEYLVVKGDTVYFRSTRKTPGTGILSKTKEIDPTDVFFGSFATTLKALKASYEELTFDIFFTPKDGSKRVFVENVEFGGKYSIEAVRDALEKTYPLKSYGASGEGSSKNKKFKRTVKIWGGAMIKRGVDGITYVPMSPPSVRRVNWDRSDMTGGNVIYRSRHRVYSYDEQSQERWRVLYDKAKQEDAMEREYYERQKLERDKRRNSAQSGAERRWQESIEKIFDAGTITYKIRRAKIK